MGTADLDAKIDALQDAVERDDRGGIARGLEAIEHELQTMNPLLRGMTYAHVQWVLGKPAEAASVLEDLLELMPDAGPVYYQLGCYRRAAEQPEAALEAFTRATELDDSLVDAWLERGTLLDAGGEPKLAIEAYRHAILLAPDQIGPWRNLGNALAALGQFDEAIDAYGTARRLHPDDAPLTFLVASAHKARGELDEANALMPEDMQRDLGEAIEVRLEAFGLDLRCRFHATAAHRARFIDAAAGLLQAIAPAVAKVDDFPHAFDDAFVVLHESLLLLCDPDAIRAQRPHRFFDATRTVARVAG